MSEMTTFSSTGEDDSTVPEDNTPPNADTSMEDADPSSEASCRSEVISEETLSLMQNTESGMDRFFEQSYSCPEVAKSASLSLIEAFDDKGLWLASLVQPEHLVRELRQQCSLLTGLVITQWVRQGETHKLKMLGEALLAEPISVSNHDSGQIMVLLADLLGILRPQTARHLLEASRPQLWDTHDLSMIREAQQWVNVGRLLEAIPPDERVFWNRRLREPQNDWDWESAEARMALQRLGRTLPRDGDDLQLIQQTVPGCWWDMWHDQPAPVPSITASTTTSSTIPVISPPPATPPAPRKRGSFTLGLLLGVLSMGAAGFYFAPWPGTSSLTATEQTSERLAQTTPENDTAPESANEPPAPPIRESLHQLKSVLNLTPEMIAAADPGSAKPTAGAVASANTSEVPPTIKPARQANPKELAREKERLAFAQKHPELKRLYNLIRGSSLREDNGLMQGRSGVAPLGSQLHQDLLRMLILDPPEQAEMRLTSTKLALRSLPTPEIISLFDMCLYPDSPNEIEVKECVSLLLDLPSDNMTEAQRKQLQAMAAGRR